VTLALVGCQSWEVQIQDEQLIIVAVDFEHRSKIYL